MRHFENAGKLRHEPHVEIVLSGVSLAGARAHPTPVAQGESSPRRRGTSASCPGAPSTGSVTHECEVGTMKKTIARRRSRSEAATVAPGEPLRAGMRAE